MRRFIGLAELLTPTLGTHVTTRLVPDGNGGFVVLKFATTYVTQ